MFIPNNQGIKLDIKIYGENNSYSLLFLNFDNFDKNRLIDKYKVIIVSGKIDELSKLIESLNLKDYSIITSLEYSKDVLEYSINSEYKPNIFLYNPIISNINYYNIKSRVIYFSNDLLDIFNSSRYDIDSFKIEDVILNELNYNILYEDNHVLVVDKEAGILSQSDSTGEIDILTKYKEYLKWRYKKKGDAYLGLVQRLDKNVSGILVLSKSTKAHTRLNESRPKKEYLAVVYGKMEKEEDRLVDKLSKDEKNHIAYLDELNGKDAILKYKVLDYKDDLSLLNIVIETGRFHQIRFQLSNINHPIYNDIKYAKNINKIDTFALGLDSYKVSFIHPVSKELITISRTPKRDIFNKFIN